MTPPSTDSTKRYFFSQDESMHWYMVDADKRAEWQAWNALPEDDERSWETPPFATRINGAVQWFTFSNPVAER